MNLLRLCLVSIEIISVFGSNFHSTGAYQLLDFRFFEPCRYSMTFSAWRGASRFSLVPEACSSAIRSPPLSTSVPDEETLDGHQL